MNKPIVLVVDGDDENIRDLQGVFLKRGGALLVQAHDRDEVLSIIQTYLTAKRSSHPVR